MFFCLSLLEDSGYMARAAFVMDRFMRWHGLPGKSFVPLLVGFGSSVPAILATAHTGKQARPLPDNLYDAVHVVRPQAAVYVVFGRRFLATTPAHGLWIT
jgi:Fe2+ transport system protein B